MSKLKIYVAGHKGMVGSGIVRLLKKNRNIELTKFCLKLVEDKIFKSPQSARNAISKAERKKLIVKKGNNKKTISLEKNINVQIEGLVLLDYKILGYESQKS